MPARHLRKNRRRRRFSGIMARGLTMSSPPPAQNCRQQEDFYARGRRPASRHQPLSRHFRPRDDDARHHDVDFDDACRMMKRLMRYN